MADMRNELKTVTAVLLAAVVAAPAYAATTSTAAASAAIQPITYRTQHYTCDAGKRVSVAYVQFGASQFAAVNYAGQQYGLAQAVSASGERYASLYGLTTANSVGNGLEWWVAKGKGTLSAFQGSDTTNTKALLTNCALRR